MVKSLERRFQKHDDHFWGSFVNWNKASKVWKHDCFGRNRHNVSRKSVAVFAKTAWTSMTRKKRTPLFSWSPSFRHLFHYFLTPTFSAGRQNSLEFFFKKRPPNRGNKRSSIFKKFVAQWYQRSIVCCFFFKASGRDEWSFAAFWKGLEKWNYNKTHRHWSPYPFLRCPQDESPKTMMVC